MAMWIPIAMTAMSMLQQQQGASDAADAAEANAQRIQTEKTFEAQQLRQEAGTSTAVSQRAALEQERQSRLVQSRTLAVAAASGGGVSDPTVVNMLARTAGEGTYRANVALYGGEERARLLRMQAAAADYEGAAAIAGGEAKAQAYETQGMSSLFSGASNLFTKYNAGGFGAGTIGGGSGGSPTGAGDIPSASFT